MEHLPVAFFNHNLLVPGNLRKIYAYETRARPSTYIVCLDKTPNYMEKLVNTAHIYERK